MEELTTTRMIYDYSELLEVYGVTYSPIEYYWQVGEMQPDEGWVLHLSVINIQLQELLQALLPALLAQKLPFRIVRDAGLAFHLLEGGLGYPLLGKMVYVYPRNAEHALVVAKWLIERTSAFRGPHIPTDSHLAGIVYTQYGAIARIPFSLPEGIAWPFGEIAAPEKPKGRKLLNYKYYPLSILKPDAKGNVIRALYFRRLWQIKSCLIKEGRPHMFADQYGRDIRDRLQWQYELHRALHEHIPMPPVFDYFEEDGNTYLAMGFIKGKTLTDWIGAVYNNRSWLYLLPSERVQLLDQLLKVLAIIGRLHQKGYIHRDITPDNFLVDKKGRIFLIDMELTWSTVALPAQPPFQLGTAGHMSPEQMAAQTPTVKEDIYGIGSLSFVFLTNLYALKLKDQEPSHLLRALEFFIGDRGIARCIAACWSIAPSERPSLEQIMDGLTTYRKKLTIEKQQITEPSAIHQAFPATGEIRNLVQRGLDNLAAPELLSPRSRWVSQSLQKEVTIGNKQMGVELLEGWHTGMAGPLWLAGLAKKTGFNVDACQAPYDQSWDYIQKNYFSQPDKIAPGLYTGGAGIALALVEGLNSGWLAPEREVLEKLQHCFSITADQLDLSRGIAGQGLALLQAADWLDKGFAEDTLASYVLILIGQQLNDGSWNIYTGIDRGTAGVLLFLLSYIERFPHEHATSSAVKALSWLENAGKRNGDQYSWPLGTNTRLTDKWNVGLGMPGIVLTYIKAYAVLKTPSYRKIAEQCLLRRTPYPVILDLTLECGLAGLGEIYLEAFRVFKDPLWLDRAHWISAVLFHCHRPGNNNAAYWTTLTTDVTTADLFSGNGGVIHFLMRILYPDKLKHPLSG